jgi:hypothetical protein
MFEAWTNQRRSGRRIVEAMNTDAVEAEKKLEKLNQAGPSHGPHLSGFDGNARCRSRQ